MATIQLSLQQSGQTIPLGADDVALPDLVSLPQHGYSAIRFRFVNTASVARDVVTFSEVANISGWRPGSIVSTLSLNPCECVEVMYNPTEAGWLVVSYSSAPRPPV